MVDEVNKWKRNCEAESRKKYYYYSLKEVHQENQLSLEHDWRAVPDKESGYYYFYDKSSGVVTWEKPACLTEWIKVRNRGETYYYNILTKEESRMNPMRRNPDIIVDPKKRLLDLLSRYYPHDNFHNECFLLIFEGNEMIAIDAIQSLLQEDLPFDEMRVSLSLLARNALESIRT